jgi:hypothetical protein
VCTSSCKTAKGWDCRCSCGGASHGTGRIAWARALSGPGDAKAAQEARNRQHAAADQLQRRINQRAGTSRNASGLVKADVRACIEYERTVLLVGWLAEHPGELKPVEELAGHVSDVAGRAFTQLATLDSSGRGARTARDHFWCAIVAQLVIAIEQLAEYEAQLKDAVADRTGQAIAQEVADAVRPSPRRSTPGVVEGVLEAAVSEIVRRSLDTLTAPADATIAAATFKLRLLAMMLCPAPFEHAVVWNHCHVPLIKGELTDELQERITAMADRLRSEIT